VDHRPKRSADRLRLSTLPAPSRVPSNNAGAGPRLPAYYAGHYRLAGPSARPSPVASRGRRPRGHDRRRAGLSAKRPPPGPRRRTASHHGPARIGDDPPPGLWSPTARFRAETNEIENLVISATGLQGCSSRAGGFNPSRHDFIGAVSLRMPGNIAGRAPCINTRRLTHHHHRPRRF